MKVALLTTDSREHYKDYEKLEPEFGAAPQALLEGFARLPEIEIHVVSCLQRRVRSPEKIGANIFYHPLVVPKIGWMRTLYSGCVRQIRRKLDEIRPDLVHGQGSEMECALAAVRSGFANVLTLHGLMDEMRRITRARPGSFYWCASLLENFALRRTRGTVCISRFAQKCIAPKCRRTWLIPNAVRRAFFDTPQKTSRPGGCVLLNVGTVCDYKRQNELLDVIGQLQNEGLDVGVRFAGSAKRTTAYGTKFLDRIQNQPHLSHVGLKSLDEMLGVYDAASALVHVSAIESFGLVVAEAMARNLKFFGFNSGGVVDIAQNVGQAELFADGDWAGLKNALANWIRSGSPRPVSATEAMRERFHPDLIARRHLEVYGEILAGQAG